MSGTEYADPSTLLAAGEKGATSTSSMKTFSTWFGIPFVVCFFLGFLVQLSQNIKTNSMTCDDAARKAGTVRWDNRKITIGGTEFTRLGYDSSVTNQGKEVALTDGAVKSVQKDSQENVCFDSVRLAHKFTCL